MKKLTAMFQIVTGSGMAVIWFLLFFTGQIPELTTEPVRIAMHIAAEILTGLSLVFSGLWLLARKRPHKILFNLSFGCLIYSLIASPGYYAQKGEWGVFVAFIAMLVASIGFLWASTKWKNSVSGRN